MSDGADGVLARFAELGKTEDAVERLREAGHHQMKVFSPFPAPSLEKAKGVNFSPVKRWALIGGITGCLTGWLLTSGTQIAYPLVTQGKPIVSVPAFIIVMFELTILLTGIFAFIGMLVHGRRPQVGMSDEYRPEFSVDRFGVFVPVGAGPGRRDVIDVMEDAGAVEIEETGAEREPEVAG